MALRVYGHGADGFLRLLHVEMGYSHGTSLELKSRAGFVENRLT
jgi:hypothetical protein